MKSALLATAAIAMGVVCAGQSQAAATQYWLASFKYPSGTFQHCFAIKPTGIYSSMGYTLSGTWVDTDYPSTAGTWLRYKTVFHFAGFVNGGGEGYLVADGYKSNGTFGSATFDFFTGGGYYLAAGSLVAQPDSGCNIGGVKHSLH